MADQEHVAALLWWNDCAPEEAYARLRVDPCYPAGARLFARNMLAQAEADRALDGILKDAGRNVAAKCVAYLHFTGGLTLPRLKALCASIGLVSPGRARALLLYLLYLGYVTPAIRRERLAPKQYLPTAQFLATWRSHMAAILESAAVIEPAAALVAGGLNAPGVFETFVGCISDGYLEGLKNVDAESAFFRVFMHRYAGTQIVHALVTKTDGAFPPEGPIGMTVSDVARRFDVSVVHVRRMLGAATREALLHLDQDGAVVLEPAGRGAIDHIYATQMIVFLTAAARTLKLQPDLVRAPTAA